MAENVHVVPLVRLTMADRVTVPPAGPRDVGEAGPRTNLTPGTALATPGPSTVAIVRHVIAATATEKVGCRLMFPPVGSNPL